MADRFGNNQNIGVGFHIKTKKNWYYGIQGTYLYGTTVKERGLLQNIFTSQGEILDNQGQLTRVITYERGFTTTLNGGKIFRLWNPNPNSGLLVMGGVGLLQHKIRIEHEESKIPQLSGDYLKGYDRLSNGLSFYQFVGYFLMSNNRLINFFAGVEAYEAFTQSRRDFNFDTQTTDTQKRRDVLVGIRLGWTLHLYARTPDAYYFN